MTSERPTKLNCHVWHQSAARAFREQQVLRDFVSVGGAYMNINESPGHARGTENFSSLSAGLMEYFKEGNNFSVMQTYA